MVLRVILWEVQSRNPACTLAAYKPGLTSTVPRWVSDSDARIVRSRQWCEMAPCLEGEVCSLLFNRSGWTCTRGSGRIKTVTTHRQTDRQTDRERERQIPGRQAGQAAEYQVCPAAAGSLAQPSGERRLLGMPMCCPDCRLALALLIG
ncbi:hypothetical protein PAMA_021061 [Pampus argenteus]